MKAFRMLYVGMLSILALASCIDNDDNSEWYGSEGVVFTTAIQSRVSGNAWNANDEVGVYMMSTGSSIDAATAKNKKYLAQSNGTLVAAPDNGIYLPESGAVDFIAYYPYTASLNGNKIAVNIADQSNPALIDLLYSNGTKGVKAEDGNTIALTFIHQLTKITLNVVKDATIESLIDLKVKLKGLATEGEFNLADGVLTAASGRDSEEIAMLVDTDGNTATVTAIILPTASGSGATPINLIFELGGELFTYTIDDASIFEKGTNVSFNAELSINNGKPVVTVGEATITDWTEKPGGDINVDFDGETQPGEETVILDEPFAEGQGAFTIDDKNLGGLTSVWSFDAKYGMKASAFTESAVEAESWLVSPELDLTDVTTAILTFDHAINKGDASLVQVNHIVQVSKDNGASWTALSGFTYPAGTDWNFVSSGDIDLSAYVGSKIKIAFQYKSTATAAATWEIKNVKVVANGEGGGDVDPDPDPEPTDTDLFISEYAEGASFNKYIEIYNPTDQDVDLSGYKLAMHNYSGSGEGGSDNGLAEVALTGTLGAKQVVVYKNSKADAYTGMAEAISDNVMNFNGNDPVILLKGDTMIDYVGVDNTAFGVDKTLRRKANVTGPSATYDVSQWEELPKGTIDGLGSHTME